MTTTPMLRQAVRTVLAGSGDRTPSNEAWALVLMAGGVDATTAAGLPARLGCVFHLGRWREHDVVAQLQAWGDALRVRAEPEVAETVDRAAASLREQVAAQPLPDPELAAAPPPAGRQPGPPPPHHPGPSGPPAPNPWAVLPAPPQSRREARGRPASAPQGPVPTSGRSGSRSGPPPAGPQGRPPARPQGRPPASNRWVVVVGVTVLVVLLGCALLGVVASLAGGTG